MTDTTNLTNVVQVDDKNGNFYWICDVPGHVTDVVTDVLVPNNVISASEITSDGARGGNVLINADDVGTDAVREVTITGDSSVATGTVKLIIRFSGNAAGMGSGHEDL